MVHDIIFLRNICWTVSSYTSVHEETTHLRGFKARRGNALIARVEIEKQAPSNPTPPFSPTLWLSAATLSSSSRVFLDCVTMSDLYTALRVSPKKKRCLPEDDDDILTAPGSQSF